MSELPITNPSGSTVEKPTRRSQLPLLLAAAMALVVGCTEAAAPPTAPSGLRASPAAPAAPVAAAAAASVESKDADMNWRAPSTPGTLREAVIEWNDVIANFFTPPVFSPGQPPPRDSRGFAMASVAIHDVLNAIDRRYAPFAYTGTVTQRVSGDAAIATAVRNVLVAIGASFNTPSPTQFVNARYAEALAAIPDGTEKSAGIALGQAVAAAVLAARAGDGSTGAPAGPFTSAQTPGAFRPLIPSPSATAVSGVTALPYWGAVRPFVVQSSAQFRSAAPYGTTNLAAAVQTPQYLADYTEVKTLGGIVSQRTADQTHIGRFWIESSAPGWNRVARTILDRRQQTAWRSARLLAQVHLAIADSYITVFESKYYYNFWRPVTAIRLGNLQIGTPANLTWNAASVPDLGPTPPVPEWPSAHAMAGAAAAEVIKASVPGTTAFEMLSPTGSGQSRSFRSVDEAVAENSLSRVYIGFHFRAATVEGERIGYLLGRYITQHGLQSVHGKEQ